MDGSAFAALLAMHGLLKPGADFKADGATRFHDTACGLNRKLKWLHSKWTHEWTTAIVRARLRKPKR
jgi:hypothetical protein